MTFTVRTAEEPLSLAPSVERAIRSLDKDQPVAEVRTMNQWVAKSLAQARFSSTLLTIFANLALALAAIGIYGVMSYAVSQRTSEIGIRLALGATMGDVLTMIVLDGLRLAVFGLALGVLLALGLSRTIAALLYQTTGTDPVTFAAVIGVLGAAALLASYLPARRASRIPPVEALRSQRWSGSGRTSATRGAPSCGRPVSSPSRSPQSRLASAPTRQSSASSTPRCYGRYRIRALASWCSSAARTGTPVNRPATPRRRTSSIGAPAITASRGWPPFEKPA
jgi:hypothetical protein